LEIQKDNGLTLFNLMGQYFQDVSLTKWTNIIAKLCPTDTEQTKANFNKCIRDYLDAVAGFPNVGDQLICWLCTAKKPALMLMHEFIGVKYSSSATAHQLSQWWLPPSNNGDTHSTREE
jgi:hypothetical protein